MTLSRYLGVPLLAALSLGISLALLPLEPNGLSADSLDQAGPTALASSESG
jgi:hypothetical protein